MNRKLTLSLEGELIDRAKDHARAKGISLSEMVEDYFKLITIKNNAKEKKLSPKIERLYGAARLSSTKTDNEMLSEALVEKYSG